MRIRHLVILTLCVTALSGAVANAQGRTHKNTPNTTLQKAFECRGVASDIDQVLKARHIVLDGQTHGALNPPITVIGFRVSDVTVFRDSGEDIYAVYLKDSSASINAALKKATWPGAAGFSTSSLAEGITRLACSISPGPASSDEINE